MVLYTYPADFTFVCASELVAFSKLQKATTTESNPHPGLRVKKLLSAGFRARAVCGCGSIFQGVVVAGVFAT